MPLFLAPYVPPPSPIWTLVPFVAGNYTASGTMTWTVGAANIGAHHYRQDGDTQDLSINVSNAPIGGTLSGSLRVAIGAGKTITVRSQGTYHYLNAAGGGSGTGLWIADVGNNYVYFILTANVPPWPAGGAWIYMSGRVGTN